MSKRTAAPTCPEWCTNHNRGQDVSHPDDEMHWVDVDTSAFTALGLGLEPVIGIYQYLDEERTSLAFWGLEVPAEADVDAPRLRGLATALMGVADKLDEITARAR